MSERIVQTGFNVVMLILSIACMIYGNTFVYPTKAYMLGIFGLIAFSCLANLCIILRTPATADEGRGKSFISRRDAQAVGLILAYAAGIPVIGFYTMSGVYFVASVILFSINGKGEWCRAVIAALSIVAIVYLLFSFFLRVPAPQGIFI